MKQKKTILLVLLCLVLVTTVLAVIHLSTRDRAPEGALMIRYKDQTSYIELSKLKTAEVTGTIVNGKGEEMEVREQGVRVEDVLKAAGIDPAQAGSVTATAADEFSAVLTGEEIREAGKAWLAEDREGKFRLIVFGDSNSKRNVRNVVRLTVNQE